MATYTNRTTQAISNKAQNEFKYSDIGSGGSSIWLDAFNSAARGYREEMNTINNAYEANVEGAYSTYLNNQRGMSNSGLSAGMIDRLMASQKSSYDQGIQELNASFGEYRQSAYDNYINNYDNISAALQQRGDDFAYMTESMFGYEFGLAEDAARQLNAALDDPESGVTFDNLQNAYKDYLIQDTNTGRYRVAGMQDMEELGFMYGAAAGELAGQLTDTGKNLVNKILNQGGAGDAQWKSTGGENEDTRSNYLRYIAGNDQRAFDIYNTANVRGITGRQEQLSAAGWSINKDTYTDIERYSSYSQGDLTDALTNLNNLGKQFTSGGFALGTKDKGNYGEIFNQVGTEVDKIAKMFGQEEQMKPYADVIKNIGNLTNDDIKKMAKEGISEATISKLFGSGLSAQEKATLTSMIRTGVDAKESAILLGAGAGAAFGTLAGPIGTVIGGALGALIGGIGAAGKAKDDAKKQTAEDLSRILNSAMSTLVNNLEAQARGNLNQYQNQVNESRDAEYRADRIAGGK